MRPFFKSSADKQMQERPEKEYEYVICVYWDWHMDGGWSEEYKRISELILNYYEDIEDICLYDVQILSKLEGRIGESGFSFMSNMRIKGELEEILENTNSEVVSMREIINKKQPEPVNVSPAPDLSGLCTQKPVLKRRRFNKQ